MALALDLNGPLAFPVTPLGEDLGVDVAAFEAHTAWMVEHRPPALFVACGTGEFASLSPAEAGELARAAVRVAGGVPVFVGAGQSLPTALEFARQAEDAGAVGLLLFPPYLREAEAEGIVAYVRAVAAATSLPLVLYQRDGIAFEPSVVERLCELPTVAGFKDGLGDVERVQRLVRTIGDRLTYFNGMPTAETYQPSYAAAGVPYYSSAVFNFVPEVSWAFWRALSAGDTAAVDGLIGGFFVPLTELRRKAKGYAISLVKVGAQLRRGVPARVRPPLVEVPNAHVAELERIVARGLELANDFASASA